MSRPFVITSALAFGITIVSPLAAQVRDSTAAPVPSSAAPAPSSPASPSSAAPAPSSAASPSSGTPGANSASTEEAAKENTPEPNPESSEAEPPETAAPESLESGPAPSGSTEDETTTEAPAPAPSAPIEEPPPAPYDGPSTLLDGDGEKMHLGGYGGLSVLGTSIYKSGGLLVGGEGAILLDHRLAIGFAGYGLASEVTGPDFANGETSILGFGYGGAVFRYHLVSKRSPVTASLGTLVGAGGLTLIEKSTSDEFDTEYDYPEDTEANAFFVAEPQIQANLHLTRWMRFGVSGGYRFVRGPTLRGINDEDLEGVTAGGHLHFGWF